MYIYIDRYYYNVARLDYYICILYWRQYIDTEDIYIYNHNSTHIHTEKRVGMVNCINNRVAVIVVVVVSVHPEILIQIISNTTDIISYNCSFIYSTVYIHVYEMLACV